jgi:hypothetical protein
MVEANGADLDARCAEGCAAGARPENTDARLPPAGGPGQLDEEMAARHGWQLVPGRAPSCSTCRLPTAGRRAAVGVNVGQLSTAPRGAPEPEPIAVARICCLPYGASHSHDGVAEWAAVAVQCRPSGDENAQAQDQAV